jgi:hypothetical protein
VQRRTARERGDVRLAVRACEELQALSRDEALAELTRRYFRSHAPATIRDFVWWSGLSAKDVKRGLEIIGAKADVVDGRTYWRAKRAVSRQEPRAAVHLVPIYDEYLVAYRDHDAVPRVGGARYSLGPALIVNGQVAGAGSRSSPETTVTVNVTVDRRLTASERDALEDAVERYGRHLEKADIAAREDIAMKIGRVAQRGPMRSKT